MGVPVKVGVGWVGVIEGVGVVVTTSVLVGEAVGGGGVGVVGKKETRSLVEHANANRHEMRTSRVFFKDRLLSTATSKNPGGNTHVILLLKHSFG